MRLFQPKIYSALLVIILTVSPHVCLVEQAIAKVANAVPGGDHEDDTHEQHDSAPSHKHDEEGSENQFCCDNNLNLFIISKALAQVDTSEKFISLSTEADGFNEQHSSFQYDYYLHRFRQPPTLRRRDKYALTCLLHAPPYV